jgi:hypothetical protein
MTAGGLILTGVVASRYMQEEVMREIKSRTYICHLVVSQAGGLFPPTFHGSECKKMRLGPVHPSSRQLFQKQRERGDRHR